MIRRRNEISAVRSLCYGLPRGLGWIQIFLDLLGGHTKRAGKKLANKLIGAARWGRRSILNGGYIHDKL